MDFFEHQEDARKRTRKLVVYYVMAVLAIVAALYLVLALGLTLIDQAEADGMAEPARPGASTSEARDRRQAAAEPLRLWHPELLLWTALGVGGVIGLGTAYKVSSLSAGGKAVAEMMNGRLISAGTTDPEERRLLNIVEEMAIASGVPVPPVYIMEEAGINAFAAGFKPADAVIGVTRGCLKTLNRDELQGVVAHEFSHILNGDMRLNIRLIGVLFGILLLTVIGRMIFHIAAYSGGGRSRSSRSGKGGGGVLAALALGIALMIIGGIGVLFARLIKSAVSRQREFLADASAVQFTRNPDGIAGALKKIGGFSSRLESLHAEEASHMFFANAMRSSLGGLLATHPPLAERIRRIDLSFKAEPAAGGSGRTAPAGQPRQAGVSGFAGGAPTTRPTDRIGTLDQQGLAQAATLMHQIPETLRSSLRTPQTARAAVYCLLLSREPGAFERQKDLLEKHLPQADRESVQQLAAAIVKLPQETRMPLVDLALNPLRQQSADEYRRFKETVQALIAADRKVSVFEFALGRSLLRNLEPVFGRRERTAVAYHSLKPLLPHCLPLLAILARYGNEQDAAQAAADFAAGVEILGGEPTATTMPETAADPVRVFEQALDILQKAADPLKKQILDACAAAVLGNQKVTVAEAELLRAVADSLDCPLPPLQVEID